MSFASRAALAALLVACGGETVPPPSTSPGVSGELAGHLDVFVVDEDTGAPALATIDVVLADGSALPAQHASEASFDDARLAGLVTVRVSGVPRPEVWS